VVLWCAVRTITGSCMESSAGAQPRDAPSRTDLQSTLERRPTSNGSPKRSRKTRTRIPLLNSLELDHVVRYRLSINSSVCIVASECAFFYFDPSLFTRRLPTMAVRGEFFPNIPISDTFRVHRFLIDADLFYIVFFFCFTWLLSPGSNVPCAIANNLELSICFTCPNHCNLRFCILRASVLIWFLLS